MLNRLNIALCQMTSIDVVADNLKSIKQSFESLSNYRDLDLVCFPENSLYMRMKEGEEVPGIALDHPAFSEIGSLAKARSCHIHLGSVALKEDGFVSNASVLVNPDGSHHVSYRKMHLFDVDLAGEKSIRESDAFKHGSDFEVIEIKGFRLAQTICYDLRFPELFSHYLAQHDVDAFLVPSAFTVPTGVAHWEVLLRARAIENQSYVLAAAQGGTHEGERGQKKTYGHSMIIDPWGEVLATATSEAPVIYSQLKKEKISAVRKQIPMVNHRKLSPFLIGGE